MIVRIGILRKSQRLTTEEFQKHWLEVHGPIAARIPELQRYCQNHVIDSEQLGIDFPRSSQDVDGFSQLWFKDLSAMKKSFTEDTVDMLVKDEQRFIGNVELIAVKQNEVIPVTNDKPLIKRMSLIKRRSDIDIETFEHEWKEVHSQLVRAMPEVEGYNQNYILDRNIKRNRSDFEDESIDGIVELWFQDTKSLEAAFASEAGQKTMAHAKTFIGEITTFIVETHQII
ncbi:EthD domain-containing protein [Alkalihalobacterium elongatum]|uniref:EthD domain-containing protein n=1 Tax=Alkalihalobacterium elongatum TaxID=2675466 RepID=UPI001C1F348F|nr:EthD domain-containing protein [Alkalihalobacterium elongatum]